MTVRIPAPLLLDSYKASHRKQYSPNTEVVYSTWTPRKSRESGIDKVVVFGIQAFIQDYLVELFNQDTGDLILGDIVLSVDKVREQAKEYGHSELREMSFLVIHSMLHLFGFDHMENDGDIMEVTQKKILEKMNITRD